MVTGRRQSRSPTCSAAHSLAIHTLDRLGQDTMNRSSSPDLKSWVDLGILILFPIGANGEKNTALQDMTLVVSLGYFLFDLCWCLYHQTETVIMIVHHVTSVVSIGMVLLERTSGAEAVAGILSLELTNPLLQMRWFLRTAGHNGTLIHTAVELLFVSLFFVMRLGFGTWLTYSVVSSNKVKTDVKLCTLALYLISLAFIFYIFQFIRKKYTKKIKDSN